MTSRLLIPVKLLGVLTHYMERPKDPKGVLPSSTGKDPRPPRPGSATHDLVHRACPCGWHGSVDTLRYHCPACAREFTTPGVPCSLPGAPSSDDALDALRYLLEWLPSGVGLPPSLWDEAELRKMSARAFSPSMLSYEACVHRSGRPLLVCLGCGWSGLYSTLLTGDGLCKGFSGTVPQYCPGCERLLVDERGGCLIGCVEHR